MELKPGTRLACPACETEVVVVAAPTATVTITCGGAELVAADAERDTDAPHAEGEGPLLGKRYVDADTGIELLCSKAGAGGLGADERAMDVKGAKPLPASD